MGNIPEWKMIPHRMYRGHFHPLHTVRQHSPSPASTHLSFLSLWDMLQMDLVCLEPNMRALLNMTGLLITVGDKTQTPLRQRQLIVNVPCCHVSSLRLFNSSAVAPPWHTPRGQLTTWAPVSVCDSPVSGPSILKSRTSSGRQDGKIFCNQNNKTANYIEPVVYNII